MAKEQKERSKPDRRQFRRTLNKLMVDRDIFFWKDLLTALKGIGYDIGQSRLSQYLSGERSPQDEQGFFDALAKALELTREEKMRLVYSWAYPGVDDRPGPADETMRRAEEAEKRIRGEAVAEEEQAYRSEGD